MPVLDRFPPTGWTVAVTASLGLLALAALPPFLGPEAGGALRHAFALVCHQLPERSLHLDGAPVALCHRCLGIGAGFVLALLAMPLASAGRLGAIARGAQARWLVLAALPAAVDWGLGALGLWANTPMSRALTGAVFGAVAGAVLAANLLSPPQVSRMSPSPTPPLDA